MLSSTKKRDDKLFKWFLKLLAEELKGKQSNVKATGEYFDLDKLTKLFLLKRYELKRATKEDLKTSLEIDAFDEQKLEKIQEVLEALSGAFGQAGSKMPEPTKQEYFFFRMRRCGLDLPDDPEKLPQVFENGCEFLNSLDERIKKIKACIIGANQNIAL